VKALIILGTYLKGNGPEAMREGNTDVYRQINDNEFLYVNSFNSVSKVAFNFALEKFDKEKLVSITASRLKWNPQDSTYTMYDYT
jgi:lipopolysaccharide export system permease protein